VLVDLGSKPSILEALEVDGQHIGRHLNGDMLVSTHLQAAKEVTCLGCVGHFQFVCISGHLAAVGAQASQCLISVSNTSKSVS
jgi:hypothetical protein